MMSMHSGPFLERASEVLNRSSSTRIGRSSRAAKSSQ